MPWKAVVSNTSKILKRKQITTLIWAEAGTYGCFQYVKDTKKKANHNSMKTAIKTNLVVSNTSKILKRKQITTCVERKPDVTMLFPIRQRY